MELVFVLGAIVAADLLAAGRGARGQAEDLPERRRAIETRPRGELDFYRAELARMERDITWHTWRL